MKLGTISSFNNFRGLYTQDESGLVPSVSESGVYASEIQNVVCKDGTIRPVGGYVPEEDDGVEPTFIETPAGNTEYFNGGTSFTMMDGNNSRVLWGNDGVAFAYSPGLKRYEVLLDFSSEITQPPNITSVVYSDIESTTPFKDTLWWAADQDGPYYYWNCARGIMTGIGPTTITISSADDMSRFYPNTSLGGVLALTAGGITYTYTSIVGNQFQGVSPDPTIAFGAGTLPISAAIFQKPVQDLPAISTAMGNGDPNIYFWYKGRLGLASTARSNVVLSELGDPFSYTYRGAGGFVAINIGDGGGSTQAVMTLKDSFVVAKKDALVAVQIKQETANNEYTKISNIVSRKNIGPIHQNAWTGGENEVYYVSIDKEFKRLIQKDDGTEIPISESVNQQIEPTMRGFEYDKSRFAFFENSVYIACREGDDNDTVIEYDTNKNTYYIHKKPVAGWVIHDNKLYFSTPFNVGLYRWTNAEDGVYDDDNGPVGSLWKSGRLKFGDMFRTKVPTLFAVYLRMDELTTVNCQLDYNNLGTLYTTNFDICGDGSSRDSDDQRYIISDPIISSFGVNKYGIEPYGTRNKPVNDEGLFDVVVFKTLPVKYKPHDISVTFSANGVGQNYRIIEFGIVQHADESVAKKAMVQKISNNN